MLRVLSLKFIYCRKYLGIFTFFLNFFLIIRFGHFSSKQPFYLYILLSKMSARQIIPVKLFYRSLKMIPLRMGKLFSSILPISVPAPRWFGKNVQLNFFITHNSTLFILNCNKITYTWSTAVSIRDWNYRLIDLWWVTLRIGWYARIQNRGHARWRAHMNHLSTCGLM